MVNKGDLVQIVCGLHANKSGHVVELLADHDKEDVAEALTRVSVRLGEKHLIFCRLGELRVIKECKACHFKFIPPDEHCLCDEPGCAKCIDVNCQDCAIMPTSNDLAELKPGTRDAFLREFHRNVPNVRAEKGCIEYGPTVDIQSGIKTQIPLREHVVTVVEQWESLEALQAHVAAPHMAAYRERVKDLVVRVSLQVLEPK